MSDSTPRPPPRPPAGTIVDTDEELRSALVAGPAPAALPANAAQSYRPTVRAPVALLTVCDDGKADGEVIRLRGERFVIGRTDGDLRLPHDGHISGRHAEIVRQAEGGRWRWVVTDLQSTHGLFVRISRTVLADRAEFLVGRGRYRFEAAPAAGGDAYATVLAPAPPAAALVEIVAGKPGPRHPLAGPECWIGSDPTCAVCRSADPFVEPRHVRLHRDARGRWHAEHNRTTNGLWLRMAQVTADGLVQFQLGEQRFRLKVGGGPTGP